MNRRRFCLQKGGSREHTTSSAYYRERECAETYNKWRNRIISQTAISISVISHHNSFQVLFDKIASVYFTWKTFFLLLASAPALCQLYRHIFVPYTAITSSSSSSRRSGGNRIRQLQVAVAPPGFCNRWEVRYGSIWGLEYEVPQSRLYCLCINVALCSTALQCICRVIRRSSMTQRKYTHIT